jgi:hypothetical protein
MKSSDLRKLSQAAIAEGAHPDIWDAIASRCEASAEQMNYWDSIAVLQAFTSVRVENQSFFLRMAEALCSKTSKLAPKMVWDLLAVYEANNIRPRALYAELFHTTIRLSRSMYAEELSLTLQALARLRLGNPTVVAHLVSAVRWQLRDFRLRYLCGVAGALGSLEMTPDALLSDFEKQATFEVQAVAVQELLENLQTFPELEYSWRPYEDLCLHELKSRIGKFQTAADVGQLADPIEAMLFLRTKGLLETNFLEAISQWCVRAVHRPNVMSERRPTARQLYQVYDRCWEVGLESSPALQDAITYYVESGGGQWPNAMPKPLRYHRKRMYIRRFDPMEGVDLPVVSQQIVQPMIRQSTVGDIPGLPSTGDGLSEWDESAIEERATPQQVNRKKCGGVTVGAFVTSRRSVRPRHRADPGLKKILRKNWHRAPLFMNPGFCSRPKYRPGVATRANPWPDVPVGPRGASWVLRR